MAGLAWSPTRLRPHIAADAEAHVGAGDVIEPHTIHAADLHIFDRLGLDREIGSLRAGQRDETSDAADQKTLILVTARRRTTPARLRRNW